MSVNYLSQNTVDAPITLASLTLDPFANTRDSRFYFDAAGHQAALLKFQAMLEDSNQGWGALIAAPGLGKTLLRTVLHRSLDPYRFLTISIENSLLGFDELLLEIISQMGGERVYANDYPDRYSRLSAFKLLLTEHVVQTDRHLVVLIDEAHGLDKQTLEYLRNLSNICAEQNNLMSIILMGGSRLGTTLRGLPELAQRIAVSMALQPLDAEQTIAYIKHRLAVAGCHQALPLSAQNLDRLHQVSRGNPRETNTILKRAMSIGEQAGSGLCDASISQALDELRTTGTHQNNDFQSPGMSG